MNTDASPTQTIKCLLIVPNPESALDEEAGKLLLEDYQEYYKVSACNKLLEDIMLILLAPLESKAYDGDSCYTKSELRARDLLRGHCCLEETTLQHVPHKHRT